MKRRVKKGRLFLLLFFVLILCFSVFFIRSLWLSPMEIYRLDRFMDQNGFKYYDDDRYESISGIDVSSHQGLIDWAQVSSSGIQFAMIRCGYRGATEGVLHQDEYYSYNIEKAIQNGLNVGVYFYSSAINTEELDEEIQFVLESIKGYDLQYPVVFDMEIYHETEGRINDLTKEETTRLTLRFCQAIQKAGYRPMIYGNLDWLTNHLDFETVNMYDIWYAAYQETPSLEYPFAMWQYSNSSQIPGISTAVDMNLYIKRK